MEERFNELFYYDEDMDEYMYRICVCNECNKEEDERCGDIPVDDCEILIRSKDKPEKSRRVFIPRYCDVCKIRLYEFKEKIKNNEFPYTEVVCLCECCGNMLKNMLEDVMMKEPDCE